MQRRILYVTQHGYGGVQVLCGIFSLFTKKVSIEVTTGTRRQFYYSILNVTWNLKKKKYTA